MGSSPQEESCTKLDVGDEIISNFIILIQRPHIVKWQYSHLFKLKEIRCEGRNGDFYLDKTRIKSNLKYRACWQRLSKRSLSRRQRKKQTLVHAVAEDHFVASVQLPTTKGQ